MPVAFPWRRSALHAAGVLLLVPGLALAADEDLQPLPEAPPPPPPVRSGEVLEPEITIKREDEATIEEYRINGRLYMVKVQPAAGPAYYLMDDDGDGRLESRYNQFYDPVVPRWVIFSW